MLYGWQSEDQALGRIVSKGVDYAAGGVFRGSHGCSGRLFILASLWLRIHHGLLWIQARIKYLSLQKMSRNGKAWSWETATGFVSCNMIFRARIVVCDRNGMKWNCFLLSSSAAAGVLFRLRLLETAEVGNHHQSNQWILFVWRRINNGDVMHSSCYGEMLITGSYLS